ncbi:MAG: glycine cleavage system aminomethyltransferase GcvT [Alphaproteobacteria bacterium]
MASPDSRPSETAADQTLSTTPLHALHRQLGGKMVPFAGYDMPVQFPMGILGEHRHTRTGAGLFDVSHMGQVILRGADHETVATALERVVPGDVAALAPGRMRYSMLLNDEGGILDDLMITRLPEDGSLFVVLNAACKADDLAYLRDRLPSSIAIDSLDDAALLALQGPKAGEVLERVMPNQKDLRFMQAAHVDLDGIPALVTRSGYTGEDGFELSVPGGDATRLATRLLDGPDVAPIGLGARDSLRLEAGLCLYGSDLDPTITPVEAGLTFVIGKRRRTAGDFPGAATILEQLAKGPGRRRIGLLPEGKAPARAGVTIQNRDGEDIGVVTSGTFAPSLEAPVAMGYVASDFSADGTPLQLMVRGQARPARVAPMPFVEHRYYRG